MNLKQCVRVCHRTLHHLVNFHFIQYNLFFVIFCLLHKLKQILAMDQRILMTAVFYEIVLSVIAYVCSFKLGVRYEQSVRY